MARVVKSSVVTNNSIKTRTASGLKMRTVDASGETARTRTMSRASSQVSRIVQETVSTAEMVSARTMSQGDIGMGIRYLEVGRSLARPGINLAKGELSAVNTLRKSGNSLLMGVIVTKIVSRKATENLKFLNDLSEHGREKAIENAIKDLKKAKEKSERILENLKKDGKASPAKVKRATETLRKDSQKLMRAVERFTAMADNWGGATEAMKRVTERNTNILNLKTAKKSLRKNKTFNATGKHRVESMKFFSKPRRQIRLARFTTFGKNGQARYEKLIGNVEKLSIANGLDKEGIKEKIKSEKLARDPDMNASKSLSKYTKKQAKKAGKGKRLYNRSAGRAKKAGRKSLRSARSFVLSAPKMLFSTTLGLSGAHGEAYSGMQTMKRTAKPVADAARSSVRTTTRAASNVGGKVWHKMTGKSFKKWAVQKAWAATKGMARTQIKVVKKTAHFAANTPPGKWTISEVKKVTSPVAAKTKDLASGAVKKVKDVYKTGRETTKVGKASVKVGQFGANLSKKMTKKTAKMTMQASMKTTQYFTMLLQRVTAKAAVAIKAATTAIEAVLGAIAAGFTALVGTVGLPLIACVGLIIIGVGVAASLGANSPGIFDSQEASAAEGAGSAITYNTGIGIKLGWTQSYLTNLSNSFYTDIGKLRDTTNYPEGYDLRIYTNSAYTASAGNTLNENFNELITELYIWSGYDMSGNGEKSLSELQEHMKEMYDKTHGCRKPAYPNDCHTTSYEEPVYDTSNVEFSFPTGEIGEDGEPIVIVVSIPTLVPRLDSEGKAVTTTKYKKYQYIDAYIIHDASVFTEGMSESDKQQFELFARDPESIGIWAKSDGKNLGYDDYDPSFGDRTLNATQGRVKDDEYKYDISSMSMATNGIGSLISRNFETLKNGTVESKLSVLASIAKMCSPTLSQYVEATGSYADSQADVYGATIKYNASAGKSSRLDNVVGCDGPGYIWQIYSADGMPENIKNAYGGYRSYAEIASAASAGNGFKYISSDQAKPGDIVEVDRNGSIYMMGIMYQDYATATSTTMSNYVSTMHDGKVLRHQILTGSSAAYSGNSYKFIRVLN